MKLLGIISVGFYITGQLLITFFCNHQILEKKWEYSERVHQLFEYLKETYGSVKREVLYNILINFRVPI
jgi:hypothetical protein